MAFRCRRQNSLLHEQRSADTAVSAIYISFLHTLKIVLLAFLVIYASKRKQKQQKIKKFETFNILNPVYLARALKMCSIFIQILFLGIKQDQQSSNIFTAVKYCTILTNLYFFIPDSFFILPFCSHITLKFSSSKIIF